ncbi:MAG: TerB family tellurite resistance protein [Flavobacteriaceae bacterium]|nr:TerB family tellurite resistance protein [Pelagibacteraceae bacterium]MBT4646459.1 TerB family tellurite resistance protein [Pelagibacteraceae bacterium]MBT5857696.1 TerB family tellurite resistance protein [Flavobacteriaceae bacterium]
MLQSLKNIFTNNDSIQAEENKEIDILSGLLIEAANTDGQITQDELNKISTSLINVFHEDAKKVEESLITALDNKDNSKSLYFYTSKLNKSFSDEKKIMLVEVLWEVILSDNEIHDFETNLIRRLAGLLYISDVECGNAKIRATQKLQKA